MARPRGVGYHAGQRIDDALMSVREVRRNARALVRQTGGSERLLAMQIVMDASEAEIALLQIKREPTGETDDPQDK